MGRPNRIWGPRIRNDVGIGRPTACCSIDMCGRAGRTRLGVRGSGSGGVSKHSPRPTYAGHWRDCGGPCSSWLGAWDKAVECSRLVDDTFVALACTRSRHRFWAGPFANSPPLGTENSGIRRCCVTETLDEITWDRQYLELFWIWKWWRNGVSWPSHAHRVIESCSPLEPADGVPWYGVNFRTNRRGPMQFMQCLKGNWSERSIAAKLVGLIKFIMSAIQLLVTVDDYWQWFVHEKSDIDLPAGFGSCHTQTQGFFRKCLHLCPASLFSCVSVLLWYDLQVSVLHLVCLILACLFCAGFVTSECSFLKTISI